MPSHSELRAAWDALPPGTRDYYHNAHLRYDSWCRPGVTGDAYYFTFTSGFNLFKANANYQLLDLGSWHPELIYLVPNYYWPEPDPTLPRGSFYSQLEFDQVEVIPALTWGYPAPARKVPKTYWTGITLPRRNL